MVKAVDLALRDLSTEHYALECEYESLMSEALAYRTMLSIALTWWAEDRDRARKLERTMRTFLGVDDERRGE